MLQGTRLVPNHRNYPQGCDPRQHGLEVMGHHHHRGASRSLCAWGLRGLQCGPLSLRTRGLAHFRGLTDDRNTLCKRVRVDISGRSAQGFTNYKIVKGEKYSWRVYLFDWRIGILCWGPDGGVGAGALGVGSLILIPPEDILATFLVFFWGVGLAATHRQEAGPKPGLAGSGCHPQS
jgi:hypothetical protein